MSQVAGSDPLIGRTFRGYRIERLIASGGMGSVYLAREESLLNVLKVIKVLLPEAAKDPSTRALMLDRFEREAFAVSVLKHDNIAGIHAYGHLDDGQPCMVMDFIEGQTLHQVVSEQGRIAPYRVMHYMCHVARGLDFAHARGIVHRDLKPENIMLSPKDWDVHFCVLLDFGMAKITQSMLGGKLATMSGMALGTPLYMAVEQFRHSDEATAQSDIYSLAIIIWYLVTGHMPWGLCDTSSPLGISDLYEVQRTKAPNSPPPGTLPPGWEETLRTALSPDPQHRQASVRHFMVELANGLESVGPHVKSGAKILEGIAPTFIANPGPDAETLRKVQTRTILEVAWPRLEMPVRPAVADIRTRPDLPRNVEAGRRTPVIGAGPTTTLGAATGVLFPRPTPVRSTRKRRLAFFGAMGAFVATVVLWATFGGRNRPIAPLSPARTELPISAAIPPAATPPAATAPAATRSTTAPAATRSTIAPTTTAPAATPPVATRSTTAPAATWSTTVVPTPHGTAATPTKKRGDEPRGKKTKFDPNAPAGLEE